MSTNKPQSTTNYDMFVFRNDNREGGVNRQHVDRLKTSIKQRNYLEFKPIVVNSRNEIIDGQHRCAAAKELSVPIWYVVQEEFKPQDLILMNLQKSWTNADYLNYYVKNHYPEYLKLQSFMKSEDIALSTALRLLKGNNNESKDDFRQGLFKMPEASLVQEVQLCRLTVDYLTKMIGRKQWFRSSRLWSAMLILFKHGDFKAETWFKNLEKNIIKFVQCISVENYMEMLQRIYNYRIKDPIELNIRGAED